MLEAGVRLTRSSGRSASAGASSSGSAPTTATCRLLCAVPGISWVLANTIAAELGDIRRFPTLREASPVLTLISSM
jgi:transposase